MENKLKVNMNEYLPLRDVVFNTLRQAILKGELEPGERLMEIQLADRLGVSRIPDPVRPSANWNWKVWSSCNSAAKAAEGLLRFPRRAA